MARAAALETWTWVLIYGGLLLLSLGLFLLRSAPGLAWALVLSGPVLVVVGVVLIFLRARLPETPSQNMPAKKE
jgi:hypothetical protein